MNEIETLFYETFVEYTKKIKNIVVSEPLFDDCSVLINTDIPDIFKRKIGLSFEITYERKNTAFKNTYCYFNFYGDNESDSMFFNGYVPDFILENKYCNFVIEIDGHEWHEKTKEQAERDKKKDRAYINSGYIPIHFTGAEIYHNTKNCIKETLELMCSYFLNSNIAFECDFSEIKSKYENLKEDLIGCVCGNLTVDAIKIQNNKIHIKKNVVA